MSNRRKGDHPWEGALRIVVATAMGLGLAYMMVSGGLHELSDVGLIVLALFMGMMWKLPLGKVLAMLPWGRKAEGE